MAKKQKNNEINIESLFNEAVREIKKEKIKSFGKGVDVLTFARDFLNVTLYPAQIIILKFLYANSRFNENLRIDDKDMEEIKKWSIDNYWITSGEFSKIKIIEEEKKICKDLVLVLGRRSGKSYLTALIAVYEAYKLLELGDPQKFYGIDSDIRILNVARNEKQAISIIFKQISKFIGRCPYFVGRIGKEKEGELYLLTDKDIEINEAIKQRDGKPLDGSIVIMAGSSNSDALRGYSCSAIIYDEMAHYVDTSGNSSAKEVYNALSRSTGTLAGKGDGRNIVISSPDLKSGFFYEHYERAKRIGSMQLFQIPAQDANPTLTEEYLKGERLKDPDTFSSEFGAEFRAFSGNAFFPPSKIDLAMTKRQSWFKTKNPIYGCEYYMHIDAASSSDNWAILIAHPEWRLNIKTNRKEMNIVEDYSEFWTPKNGEYLNEDEIMDKAILPLIKKFKIVSVSYDHMFSIPQRFKLQNNNIPNRLVSFSGRSKNEMYSTLRDYFIQEKVELCSDDIFLEGELKAILVDYTRVPPKIRKDPKNFEFPNDDLADALAGVVNSMALGPTGRIRLPRTTTAYIGRR